MFDKERDAQQCQYLLSLRYIFKSNVRDVLYVCRDINTASFTRSLFARPCSCCRKNIWSAHTRASRARLVITLACGSDVFVRCLTGFSNPPVLRPIRFRWMRHYRCRCCCWPDVGGIVLQTDNRTVPVNRILQDKRRARAVRVCVCNAMARGATARNGPHVRVCR